VDQHSARDAVGSTVAVVSAPLRDCIEDAVFNRMIQ
jgi:hypothetical protein